MRAGLRPDAERALAGFPKGPSGFGGSWVAWSSPARSSDRDGSGQVAWDIVISVSMHRAGSTPQAARPSGHGAAGGADRNESTFGCRRDGQLVRWQRGFGSGVAGLRPPYSRWDFGPGGVRVESFEPAVVFGSQTGERHVRFEKRPSGRFEERADVHFDGLPSDFGPAGRRRSGQHVSPNGASALEGAGAGRTKRGLWPRMERRPFGFGGLPLGSSGALGSARLRPGRADSTSGHIEASVSVRRAESFGRRGAFGFRIDRVTHPASTGLAPRERMDSSSSGSLRRRERGGRLCRAGAPSGALERCRRAQPAVSTGRFGGRGARFGRFGGRSSDRRARWQRAGTNVKRGSAPETAYGHAVGAKLWRVQPHERIRHETRPAGSRRMEEGVERL
jgi:hypothetical protein